MPCCCHNPDEQTEQENAAKCPYIVNKSCASCGTKDDLKACVKCKFTFNCSKECQKADWKVHKILCGICMAKFWVDKFKAIVRAETAQAKDDAIRSWLGSYAAVNSLAKGDANIPSSPRDIALQLTGLWTKFSKKIPGGTPASSGLPPELVALALHKLEFGDPGLQKVVALIPSRAPKPHHWLHGRADDQVFNILVDAFRLVVAHSSIIGHSNDVPGDMWSCFVAQVKASALIPPSWTEAHFVHLEQYGRSNSHTNNVYTNTGAAEIAKRHNDKFMPLKLMILAAQITGLSFWQFQGAVMQKWVEDSVFWEDENDIPTD